MSDTVTTLTLGELFNTSDEKYQVPIYQRNYDWGRAQIEQLIRDINDYASADDHGSKDAQKRDYYLGALVVNKKSGFFEVVDGQQRLTTLTLIFLYLCWKRNESSIGKLPILSFEGRDEVNVFLANFATALQNSSEQTDSTFIRLADEAAASKSVSSILHGLKFVSNAFSQSEILAEPADRNRFYDYLCNNVKLLRVEVPRKVDMNHYFEVMNNRGEQLERHEIVKAKLMAMVKDSAADLQTFQQVWLACSNMNRYVQTSFSIDIRKQIFAEDDCGTLTVIDYECLLDKLGKSSSDSDGGEAMSLSTLLAQENTIKLPAPTNIEVADEKNRRGQEEERFTSIIDFPNFLMHVLRIFVLGGKQPAEYEESFKLPPLDDKNLVNEFERCLGLNENMDGVAEDAIAKNFIFLLLKTRYLFDRYIVKREQTNDKNDWALQRYKLYETSGSSYVSSFSGEDGASDTGAEASCKMLLAAFQVSFPASSYKNWLSSVLYWLNKTDAAAVTSAGYLTYLEQLAAAIMVKRYLTDADDQQVYDGFIYRNDMLGSLPVSLTEPNIEKLMKFLEYPRASIFAFNYLDFLLWKRDRQPEGGFRFGYDDSVEHFYPQASRVKEDGIQVDHFGNLCLVNRELNSRLGNNEPVSKARMLSDGSGDPALYSLKLRIMKDEAEKWEQKIVGHGEEMLKIVCEGIKKAAQ